MPLSETTYNVHAFPQSQQSAGDRAPRYALRRVNIPGPNTGFPYVINFGPKTITATTSGQLVFQIPGSVRPLAFGWYSLSSGGASTFRVCRTSTFVGAAAGTGSIVGVQPAGATGVLVSTDAAGLAYSRNTTDTYSISHGSGYLTDGVADGPSVADPEVPPVGASSLRTFLEIRFTTAVTVADFMCYLLAVPTKHANTLQASD